MDSTDSGDGSLTDSSNSMSNTDELKRQTVTNEDFDYRDNNVNVIEEGEEEISNDAYELSEEDLKGIVEEIKKIENGISSSDPRATDYDFISKTYSLEKYNKLKIKVDNQTMEYNPSQYDTLKANYSRVISKVGNNILLLNKHLTKIFRQDKEEKEYKPSGTLSINRLASGSKSTRIFTKTRNPKNKDKMKVCILIDESGSMSSGNKCLVAKEIAIVMAEVFGKLKIPLSVIGFTTSMKDNIIQHIYLNWDNTPDNRLKLLNISSYNCNFDAYTIRYATELMKKKKSEYDIMIIISDGEPSAGPGSREERFADTANAIKEAKKQANVIGIGLGFIDTGVFARFYGNDFIHVKNVDELPIILINAIKKIVKKW